MQPTKHCTPEKRAKTFTPGSLREHTRLQQNPSQAISLKKRGRGDNAPPPRSASRTDRFSSDPSPTYPFGVFQTKCVISAENFQNTSQLLQINLFESSSETDNFANSLVSRTKLVKYVAVVVHAVADVVGICKRELDIKDDRCTKNRWEGGCSADQTLLLAGQLRGAKEQNRFPGSFGSRFHCPSSNLLSSSYLG